MTGSDDTALAGYHMYFAPPLVSPSGNAAPMRGPLSDDSGRALMIAPGVELDPHVYPELIPGRYLLVPVDARGRELPHLQRIEKQIVDTHRTRLMQAVTAEATLLVMGEALQNPKLATALFDLVQSGDKQGLLLHAMQRAGQEIWGGPVPDAPLDEETRRRLVKMTADKLIESVRGVLAQDDPQRYRLEREGFDALVKQPLVLSVDHIMASAARADYEDAAVRALAKLYIREELPFWFVGDILPGLGQLDVFLILIRYASGDIVGGLIELFEKDRFPRTLEGSEQRALALFALWTLGGAPVRRPVLRWMRRLIRTPLSVRAAALLLWLARELADAGLNQIVDELALSVEQSLIDGIGTAAAHLLARGTLDDVILRLPQRRADLPFPGVSVRAPQKPRPNEPCPCGSGLKVKKCHGDRALELVAPAASRGRQIREASGRIQPDQVPRLARVDLARMDLGTTRDDTLVQLLRWQMYLADWDRAGLIADELASRPSMRAQADTHRYELITWALRYDQHEVASKQIAKLLNPETAAGVRVMLAHRADESATLADLRTAAKVAVEDPTGANAFALATLLMSFDKSLAILVARSALRPDQLDNAAVLIQQIEDARDDLLLPPGDPAIDLFTMMGGVRKARVAADQERASLAKEADSLRNELEAKTRRLSEMERDLERREQELREARQRADDAQAQPTRSEQERRASKEKIGRLEALVREKNEQLAESRRALAVTSAPTPVGTSATVGTDDDDDEDELEEAQDAAPRTVLVARYTPRAATALAAVPRNVGSIAARTVGALAAGDDGPWRSVKQAKDMPRQVLMARIGIHYRLLFRCDTGGELEVVDLVTREDLMLTLKRLRNTRSP